MLSVILHSLKSDCSHCRGPPLDQQMCSNSLLHFGLYFYRSNKPFHSLFRSFVFRSCAFLLTGVHFHAVNVSFFTVCKHSYQDPILSRLIFHKNLEGSISSKRGQNFINSGSFVSTIEFKKNLYLGDGIFRAKEQICHFVFEFPVYIYHKI